MQKVLVDRHGDNAIDEASLKVEKRDFDHALDSGEACAAFGAKAASLEPISGTASWTLEGHLERLTTLYGRLVEQVRTSQKTPLMTVLLEGRAHGKTALAACKNGRHFRIPLCPIVIS